MKALLALSLSALTAIAVTDAVSSAPKVRIANRTPLVIRGAGFVPRERLTVSVTTDLRHTKVVRASGQGAFSARLTGIRVQRCDRIFVVVTGSSGDRASLRSLPECVSQE